MSKNSDFNQKEVPDFRKEKIIDLRKIAEQKKKEIKIHSEEEKKNAPLQPVNDKTVFWWTMAENSKIQHGFWWYVIIGAALILAIIFAISQKNWLFLVFIVLVTIIYYLLTTREPAKRMYRINSDGLTIENKLFSFKELVSFSLHQKADQNYIMFETNHLSQKYLSAPLKKDDEKIAEFLREYLPEKEYNEPFSETLRNFLGL
ncbi:MAG: hypothetical protein Q8N90_04185 [bacterium]|nr:hypothetical protein [bacterium]